MKISILCIFSLLVLGTSAEVDSEDLNLAYTNIENVIEYIQETNTYKVMKSLRHVPIRPYALALLKGSALEVGNTIAESIEEEVVGPKAQLLAVADKELRLLKGKQDSCSVDKRNKLESTTKELRLSFCFDFTGFLSNITNVVNTSIHFGVDLLFDIGNFTTSITNCTRSPNRTVCYRDSLQALENDVTKESSKLGDIIAFSINTIIDLIKNILSCFQGKQSQLIDLEDLIQTTCKADTNWKLFT